MGVRALRAQAEKGLLFDFASVLLAKRRMESIKVSLRGGSFVAHFFRANRLTFSGSKTRFSLSHLRFLL